MTSAYDENGRYIYRSAGKRGAKGVGKDPVAAAHGNIELARPIPTNLGWRPLDRRSASDA